MAGERTGRRWVPVGVAGLALVVWLIPANADAYIDPGTGSLVVQVLVAALVTVGVLARSFWSRLTGIFRRRRPEPPRPEDRNPTTKETT